MDWKKKLCLLLAAVMLLAAGCAPWGPPTDGSMRTLPPRNTPAAPSSTAEVTAEPVLPAATAEPAADGATPVSTPVPLPTHAAQRDPAWDALRTVPFGEMRYRRPDAEALVASLEEIAGRIAAAADAGEQCSLLDEGAALYDTYSTMYVLASVRLDQDTEDLYWTEEMDYLESTTTDVDYAMADIYRALLASPWRDALTDTLGGSYIAGMQATVDRLQPGVRPLLEREEKLRGEYMRLSASATVTVEGEKLTLSQIGELYDTHGYYAYIQALEMWMTRHNRSLGRIYLELVKVRQEMAAELGYDSYTEMAYADHGYAYGPEDVAAIREDIKEYLVPVYAYAGSTGLISLPEVELSREEFMEFLREALYAMDESLGEAFDFMEEYDLALLDPGAAKIDGAYTTYLYDYDAPVLTGSWLGDAMSMYTVIHEFGHFHDYYAYPEAAMNATLDTAEIFSTALEMLVSNRFIAVMEPDEAIRTQDYAVMGLLETYVIQTAYEEFEARVYASDPDTLTLDDINGIFMSVQQAYGLDIPGMEWYDRNAWVSVMHFFEVPFYTFSYTAAADAAMQIWFRSLYGEDEALDVYFDLLDREGDEDFLENMEDAGLETVFDEGHIEELAGIFSRVFAIGPAEESSGWASGL